MPTLNWLNRPAAFDTASQIPYRLLDTVSTHKAAHSESNATRPESSPVRPEPVEGQFQDNLLIQGDNLEALKALLPFYRGRVKCIFIDPPYNTKSAFEHYDDNLEHAQWLTMMLPRLQLLRQLLSEDGSIWVTIDDNEGHYLKVLMDEVFGRGNFVANVVWEKSDSPKMDSLLFSTRHDHLHVFAKNASHFSLKKLQTSTASHYDKVDENGRLYYLKPLRAMGGQGDSREARPNLYFGLFTPDGTEIFPKRTDGKDGAWRWSYEKIKSEIERIEWRKGRADWSPYFRIYADTSDGRPAETIWFHADVGSNRTSKAEVKNILDDDIVFTTPKPERLLQRILELATNAGDLVLDSFLGSGTTAAVAHKMGRRWIGIEMGDHAQTHCLPRLQKVLDGEQGGISKAVGWHGGGGFRFARLGETVFTEGGLINPAVRFATLAAFVWQQETGTAFQADVSLQGGAAGTPLIGVYAPQLTSSTAYYLLFNGILGDKRPAGGNVLTRDVLAALLQLHKTHAPQGASVVVYGEACLVGPARLGLAGVRFSQIPYELRVR